MAGLVVDLLGRQGSVATIEHGGQVVHLGNSVLRIPSHLLAGLLNNATADDQANIEETQGDGGGMGSMGSMIGMGGISLPDAPLAPALVDGVDFAVVSTTRRKMAMKDTGTTVEGGKTKEASPVPISDPSSSSPRGWDGKLGMVVDARQRSIISMQFLGKLLESEWLPSRFLRGGLNTGEDQLVLVRCIRSVLTRDLLKLAHRVGARTQEAVLRSLLHQCDEGGEEKGEEQGEKQGNAQVVYDGDGGSGGGGGGGGGSGGMGDARSTMDISAFRSRVVAAFGNGASSSKGNPVGEGKDDRGRGQGHGKEGDAAAAETGEEEGGGEEEDTGDDHIPHTVLLCVQLLSLVIAQPGPEEDEDEDDDEDEDKDKEGAGWGNGAGGAAGRRRGVGAGSNGSSNEDRMYRSAVNRHLGRSLPLLDLVAALPSSDLVQMATVLRIAILTRVSSSSPTSPEAEAADAADAAEATEAAGVTEAVETGAGAGKGIQEVDVSKPVPSSLPRWRIELNAALHGLATAGSLPVPLRAGSVMEVGALLRRLWALPSLPSSGDGGGGGGVDGSGDERTLRRGDLQSEFKETVTPLLLAMLTDSDSYVFLAAVEVLVQVAHMSAESILPQLTGAFMDVQVRERKKVRESDEEE